MFREVVQVVGVAVGCAAVTGAILLVVFRSIRRLVDQDAELLHDVVLDSGRTTVTTRFERFRTERLRRGGIKRQPGRVVLTSSHLHVVQRPQLYGVFAHDDLPRFTIGSDGRQVHLRSTDPPGAAGTIDYRFDVPDPAAWVDALVRAGARSAS